ncbi:hypothetical protein [Pacificispira sp.]|uniref:hypothetical protein n=1 Tax=Pacificispira sp. TaxID=2888761 RepID=UPI003B524F81
MQRGLFYQLEKIGRVRLSRHFFMRDFLHSEIGAVFGIPNIPEDIDLAVENGIRLCTDILEPIVTEYGPIQVRSGYRSPTLNDFGYRHRLKCASNENNAAFHIWDRLDRENRRGASTCIVIPWCLDNLDPMSDGLEFGESLKKLVPFDMVTFFTNQFAFNIGWREEPRGKLKTLRSGGHLHRSTSSDQQDLFAQSQLISSGFAKGGKA